MKKFDWESYLLHLGLIIVATYIFLILFQKLLKVFFEKTNFIEKRKRETFFSFYKTLSKFVALLVVIVSAINPFVDLTKMLAGAGILGVVVAIGAQSLIKDLLTGFFMIYERQIHKDDSITINQKYSGTVEEIGFRVLRIRQYDGNQLIIPNGEIKEILNGNMQKRRIIEKVVVSFREDPTLIIELLEEVCAELNKNFSEELYRDENGQIIEHFKVHGISNLNSGYHGYEYTITGLMKDNTYFGAVWSVRKMIAQKLFDKNIKMAEENIRYQARMHL